ncbi:MAG: hypothetical protein ACK42H_02205 [Planctomycetota bacterium]|jgi:hypothetical protein
MHPITNEPNAIYYFGNSYLIWSLIFAFLSGCNRQEPQVASSPTTAKLDSRPALQDILEKSVRELGGPLGGQKVDCSELKVELNHVGQRRLPLRTMRYTDWSDRAQAALLPYEINRQNIARLRV